ncbi:hypothetical protein [Paenibacillus kribbensis]|uniref:hypothetical protein n=1 Tax=Paenibacillus kribbensis TaxID=172713 RepID=UPI0012FDF767|nr:hypothetical protein [Paenibacillus kribbensis]
MVFFLRCYDLRAADYPFRVAETKSKAGKGKSCIRIAAAPGLDPIHAGPAQYARANYSASVHFQAIPGFNGTVTDLYTKGQE